VPVIRAADEKMCGPATRIVASGQRVRFGAS